MSNPTIFYNAEFGPERVQGYVIQGLQMQKTDGIITKAFRGRFEMEAAYGVYQDAPGMEVMVSFKPDGEYGIAFALMYFIDNASAKMFLDEMGIENTEFEKIKDEELQKLVGNKIIAHHIPHPHLKGEFLFGISKSNDDAGLPYVKPQWPS